MDDTYGHAMLTVNLVHELLLHKDDYKSHKWLYKYLITKESITSKIYFTCLPFPLVTRNILFNIDL